MAPSQPFFLFPNPASPFSVSRFFLSPHIPRFPLPTDLCLGQMVSPRDDIVYYNDNPVSGNVFPSQNKFLEKRSRSPSNLCMEEAPLTKFSNDDLAYVKDRKYLKEDTFVSLTRGALGPKVLSILNQNLDNYPQEDWIHELFPYRRRNGGLSGLGRNFRDHEDRGPETTRLKRSMWFLREKFSSIKIVVGMDISVSEVTQYEGELLVGC